MVRLFSQGYQEKYWCGEIPGTFCLWCTVYGHLMAIFWLGGPMGTSLKNPLTYAGVYCSDTLFIMQVLYRIIYCDDNVVMMPKGREQVLSSTWGANKEDTFVRNPLQSPSHHQKYSGYAKIRTFWRKIFWFFQIEINSQFLGDFLG